MPKRIFELFAPPDPESGEAGNRRWQWGVSLAMYVNTVLWAWALGVGALFGLDDSGLTRQAATDENREIIDEVNATVKCGNLQNLIQSLNDSIYEVERQIEDDGPAARESDRRRLSMLEGQLRQKDEAFRSLDCAVVLEG